MANYALVKIINSVETVGNIIVADAPTAATYLVANGGAYDYALDASLYDPAPEMGWLYDTEHDTFSAPAPPEDFEGELRAKVEELHEVLMEALDFANNLNSTQIENAIDQGIGDVNSGFTTNEADLFSAISDFITNGG